MGYLHIENLYKNKDILLFKQCYAMEKIHGTSAHITINKDENIEDKVVITFFVGGEKFENFVRLFDIDFLKNKFKELNLEDITIFGEAYGGKQQAMSVTYGKELKFVAFDVLIGHRWLDVLKAEQFCKDFNIEFVHYELVDTDIEILDRLASAPSVQAKRNGIIEDKIREGIVLRPIVELIKNNETRIIVKHKNEQFKERQHQPKLTDNLEVLSQTNKIVDEWITEMRLSHILDKKEIWNIENIVEAMNSMVEDVLREGKDEILINKDNRELVRTIKKRTAELYKKRLNLDINR